MRVRYSPFGFLLRSLTRSLSLRIFFFFFFRRRVAQNLKKKLRRAGSGIHGPDRIRPRAGAVLRGMPHRPHHMPDRRGSAARILPRSEQVRRSDIRREGGDGAFPEPRVDHEAGRGVLSEGRAKPPSRGVSLFFSTHHASNRVCRYLGLPRLKNSRNTRRAVLPCIASHSSLAQINEKTHTHTHTHIDDDRILQVEAIRTLLEKCPGVLPIACGGGGVPVARVPSNPRTLVGVEAVIDKDRCGAMLANELDADGLIILTDGGGIWQNFGKPDAREMKVACYFLPPFYTRSLSPPD